VAFIKLARAVSQYAGHPIASALAFSFIVGWAMMGPKFDYSEQWQLIVNTTTTIITFLMVFLIQSSQNHDTEAIHAKLDELIRSSDARNELMGIERDEDHGNSRTS